MKELCTGGYARWVAYIETVDCYNSAINNIDRSGWLYLVNLQKEIYESHIARCKLCKDIDNIQLELEI